MSRGKRNDVNGNTNVVAVTSENFLEGGGKRRHFGASETCHESLYPKEERYISMSSSGACACRELPPIKVITAAPRSLCFFPLADAGVTVAFPSFLFLTKGKWWSTAKKVANWPKNHIKCNLAHTFCWRNPPLFHYISFSGISFLGWHFGVETCPLFLNIMRQFLRFKNNREKHEEWSIL